MIQNKMSFIRATFLFLILSVSQVWATDATILPQGLTQFFDNNGNPLTSGKVYFYIPNTLTFKTTWQNAGKTITNTNPVILDAAGRATIYGDGIYRQILRKSDNTLVWDALTASTGGGGGTGGTGDGTAVGTVLPFAGLVAPTNYVFSYGQEISRATFASFLTAITISTSVTCSIGSPTVNIADTTQIPISSVVELSCVAPGTTVISKTSSSVTFNNNSSLTSISNAVFFPFGNGNGTTTFNVPDLRGRVIAGRDCMGGTAASRLTATYFAACGTGATGGLQSSSLVTANLPPYTPAGTNSIPTITVSSNMQTASVTNTGPGNALQSGGGPSTTIVTAVLNTAPVFTGTAQGGVSTAFSIVQPTMELNYIIKVIPDTSGGGGGGGTGNVVGPNSSTDNAIVRWDGLTGALIKDTPNWLIANGMFSLGVSGGDQGVGTINAGGFFINAIPVVTTTGAQALTNKTISGASNTLTVLANTQLTNQVPVANGGTGQATAQTARGSLGLNIDAATSTGDANYTILPADRLIYHTALSTARTDTLPAASAVNVGQTLYIPDIRGVATASNTLTVQRAGSDTLNGSTSYIVWDVAYSTAECWSDGVSRWTCQKFAAGGGGGGVSSITIAAGTNITLGGTCTVTSTGTCTINASGGVPGGSTTQVQINNAGAFAGITDATLAGRVIGGSNLQIQYNNAGVFGALTDTQLAARVTPLNNTWTGVNIFNGFTYFGSGRPYIDVMSGGNGCAAAVGNGSTDDTTAIQCQLNYIHNTTGGGFLYFPRTGNCFKVTSTLTVYASTTIVGSGMNSSCITTATGDFVAVQFVGSSNAYNGARDILIVCSQSTSATQSCVFVDDNTPVNFFNVWILGGYRALDTHGVDGRYIHVVAQAAATTTSSAHLFSRGSNFFIGCKFDGSGPDFGALISLPYTSSSSPMENQFTQTDFSGTFGSAAFAIDDGGNIARVAITKCVDCIFGGAIIINNSLYTSISTSELSSLAHNGGALSIASSYGFGGFTVSGAGSPRSCAANINITC